MSAGALAITVSSKAKDNTLLLYVLSFSPIATAVSSALMAASLRVTVK